MSKIKKVKKIFDEIMSRFDKLGGYELFYNYNSEKLIRLSYLKKLIYEKKINKNLTWI